jgi:hypothetical protein
VTGCENACGIQVDEDIVQRRFVLNMNINLQASRKVENLLIRRGELLILVPT